MLQQQHPLLPAMATASARPSSQPRAADMAVSVQLQAGPSDAARRPADVAGAGSPREQCLPFPEHAAAVSAGQGEPTQIAAWCLLGCISKRHHCCAACSKAALPLDLRLFDNRAVPAAQLCALDEQLSAGQTLGTTYQQSVTACADVVVKMEACDPGLDASAPSAEACSGRSQASAASSGQPVPRPQGAAVRASARVCSASSKPALAGMDTWQPPRHWPMLLTIMMQ